MENHVEAHRKVKRRKVVHDAPEAAIRSAGDLHRLLTSQEEIRTAIQLFKEFLLEIPQLVDNEGRAKRLQILKVYSEEQLSLNQQASTFPDLISAWTAAVESNNESILSSVPSVLALYLKTVSSLLDFRDIGLSLCRSLLFKDHLRLFDRGLTATKTKEHLISPCLRLLTEIVSFDGGEVAGLVYSKRDTTFRRLELFLDQRAPSATGSADVRQKPTLRRIAQRYLLANLKFQSASAKGDIIAQGKILKSCTQNLRSDGADIIRDVLTCLENDIIKADSLTKSIKNRLFDYSTLCSLSKLYTFHEEANEVSTSKSIRDHVDDVLRLICTVEETGILLPQNGWYPPGSKSEKTPGPIADSDTIETGVDSALSQQQKNRFGVKNVVLSTFIQGLRPDTDSLQASLLLDIFRAAPELVADYFAKKNNFIVEPKDTPAWLGQSAFLFSTIQLPVPDYCGWRGGYAELPPPSPAVLESILPRPLDRMVTTRCLNINHEVITLFAIRALTVAFQKLSRVLETYNAATHDSDSWRQAASDLLMSFSQRCPLAKDVLTTLQRTPQSDEQLRGAIFELIAKYHQVLPQLMLVEKFDISLSLVDAIKRVESDLTGASLKPLRFAELENLLAIAQMSLDTKWWQKPGKLRSLKMLA